MRTHRLLLPALLAANLLGCQTPPGNGSINDLPSSDPTAASTDLATG